MSKKFMSYYKIIDYVDVPLLSIGAISITFTDVEDILKLTSLVIAIGYTTWKWISDVQAKKTGKPIAKIKKKKA